ncbi:hypothetical protein [Megasphaera stantonii]|uniref:hypothetical protein n=1 Tax=Megasphaera stantonii TaxID=2144175 RepID=UPI003207DF6D
MALVNKHGQTPTQVAEHEELTQQIEAIQKQQEQLQQQIEALGKTMTPTMDTLLYNIRGTFKFVDDMRVEQKHAKKKIQWYLFIGILMLAVLQAFCFTSLRDELANHTQALLMIHDTLSGNAAYWYDATNHQLYVRNRSTADQ